MHHRMQEGNGMRTWKQIIEDNKITSEDVPTLEAKLFFEESGNCQVPVLKGI